MSHTVERVTSLNQVQEQRPTFLAIGSFDGVHRGHQQLLQEMVAAARRAGARTAALTFFPHPRRVIRGEDGRFYLTTLAQREALLVEQGLDLLITHPFNEEVRHTRAADFVDSLCQYLDMRQLWGGNFALGYKREGDVPFLRNLGRKRGFTVNVVETMARWNNELVSSSRIRQSVSQGNVEDAAGCLGRPYRLPGRVIKGQQRGQSIGFPTANLAVWKEQLLPGNGVYAGYAWVDGRRYSAATNVGTRPTVDGQSLSVEAHLLDYEGDLYGREIALDFISRLRPEQKFNGLEALVAQITADVAEVRQRVGSG